MYLIFYDKDYIIIIIIVINILFRHIGWMLSASKLSFHNLLSFWGTSSLRTVNRFTIYGFAVWAD